MITTRIGRLFYFDEQGIRDLLGQIDTWELSSTTHKMEGTGSIEGTAKASIKGLVSQLLGLEAEGSATAKGEVTAGREGTYSKYRASLIREFIEKSSSSNIRIHETLGRATEYVTNHPKDDCFLLGDVNMDIPEFTSADGIRAALEIGVIQWQKHFGLTALERNFAVKPRILSLDDPRRIPIVMSMSVSKISESLGLTGHLTTYIRGYGAEDIPMKVLASIRRTPLFFQLKPYAAWV